MECKDCEKSYNGWKNYETWCVNLWLTNNQHDYENVYAAAQDIDEDYDVWDLSKYIKHMCSEALHWHNERNSLKDASMFTDLLQNAFDNVEWYDIALAFAELAED